MLRRGLLRIAVLAAVGASPCGAAVPTPSPPPFTLTSDMGGLLVRNDTPGRLNLTVQLTRDGQLRAAEVRANACSPIAPSASRGGTDAPASSRSFSVEPGGTVCVTASDGRSAEASVWSKTPAFVARAALPSPPLPTVFHGERLRVATDRAARRDGCDGRAFQSLRLLSATGARATACMNGGRFLHFVPSDGATGDVELGVYTGAFAPWTTAADPPKSTPITLIVRRPWWFAAVLVLLGVAAVLLPPVARDLRRTTAALTLALRQAGRWPLVAPYSAGPYTLDVDVARLRRFLESPYLPGGWVVWGDAEVQGRAVLAWEAVEHAWTEWAQHTGPTPARPLPPDLSGPSHHGLNRGQGARVLDYLRRLADGVAADHSVPVDGVTARARKLTAAVVIARAIEPLTLRNDAQRMDGASATDDSRRAYAALETLLYEDVPVDLDPAKAEAYAKTLREKVAAYAAVRATLRGMAGVMANPAAPTTPSVQTSIGPLWAGFARELMTWNVAVLVVSIALALYSALGVLYFQEGAWGAVVWDYAAALAWGGVTAGAVKGIADALDAFKQSVWDARFRTKDSATA